VIVAVKVWFVNPQTGSGAGTLSEQVGVGLIVIETEFEAEVHPQLFVAVTL
jgi:hypothetical protein